MTTTSEYVYTPESAFAEKIFARFDELITKVNIVNQQNADIKQQNADISQQNVDIKQQNVLLTEKIEVVTERLEAVEAKLERIEANTIIIRDRVLSDFENIRPETKAALEKIFTMATAPESESMLAAENLEQYLAKQPKHISMKRIVNETLPGRTVSHGELSAFGDFVNKFSKQLFGVYFRNRWASDFAPAIQHLCKYFFEERNANNLQLAGRLR